jgi:hypothetical protein
MKTLEEQAEEFAKKRTELDPIYANGLYYGFIECAKSEWFKEQIINAFIGFDSFTDDNIKVAKQFFNETYGQINQSEEMGKEITSIKIVHAEVMQEQGLSMTDLPQDIQSKIKGFNLMKMKFFQDTTNEKMMSILNKATINIADEILNYLKDNPIQKNDISDEDEINSITIDISDDDEINSRTIDISDLAGVYNLGDMPNVIQRIQDRIEKVKNGERLFISTMEMSHHLRNCLMCQFETLTELSNVTKKQVSTMQGMGVKVMAELEKVMERHGIKFKPLY